MKRGARARSSPSRYGVITKATERTCLTNSDLLCGRVPDSSSPRDTRSRILRSGAIDLIPHPGPTRGLHSPRPFFSYQVVISLTCPAISARLKEFQRAFYNDTPPPHSARYDAGAIGKVLTRAITAFRQKFRRERLARLRAHGRRAVSTLGLIPKARRSFSLRCSDIARPPSFLNRAPGPNVAR